MEHCESTLRALIDSSVTEASPSGLSVEMRWRLVRQTLEALSYMHSKGIMHR
jgi:serine/threonine protein kinase